MKKTAAVLLALSATALCGVPAHAEMPGPKASPPPSARDARVPAAYAPGPRQLDEALRARVAGTTFRAEVWDGFLLENHIHRFRPDGSVDGEFAARRLIRQGIDFVKQHDRGRWTVDGGRLCVVWRKFFLGKPQCYSLSPARPGWVRFSNEGGGPSFLAQFSR